MFVNPVHNLNLIFWYVIAISAMVLVGITAAMIFFAIRHYRARSDPHAGTRPTIVLEIAWTVIPTLIALWMFYLGWKSYVG